MVAKVSYWNIIWYFCSITTIFFRMREPLLAYLWKISKVPLEFITKYVLEIPRKKLHRSRKNFNTVGKTSSKWEKLHRPSGSFLMKFFQPPCSIFSKSWTFEIQQVFAVYGGFRPQGIRKWPRKGSTVSSISTGTPLKTPLFGVPTVQISNTNHNLWFSRDNRTEKVWNDTENSKI